jgi:hypothetical protein
MALHVDKLHLLLKVAVSKSLPLIVVGAERDADWSTYGGTLDDDFSPKFLRVGNLSTTEIEGLLDLLDRHDCLGRLKEKRREDQVKAFAERADRQLLVALHELTQGKPFEEIIFAEHQRVHPEQARQLYLDIATMHQFSVKVRAGTISRISGIDFLDYKERFFEPLKNIVTAEDDPYRTTSVGHVIPELPRSSIAKSVPTIKPERGSSSASLTVSTSDILRTSGRSRT